MSQKQDPDEFVAAWLAAGTREFYDDAALYDHEYRRRRRDIQGYRRLVRELAPGGPVLELGCGTGRLLIPLARDGHQVVGIDLARPMLRRCAERLARLPASRRAAAVLLQADLRAVPLSGPFPLILCPFNAFMHLYERPDVEAALGEVRRLLAPGGTFVFDVLNPDPRWLARDPQRRWARTRMRHPESGEPLVYTTNHLYDPMRQVAFMRIYYELPQQRPESLTRERVVHLAHRQFFPAELEALLHYNGFTIERREGGFEGEPFTPESTEQVIRARVR